MTKLTFRFVAVVVIAFGLTALAAGQASQGSQGAKVDLTGKWLFNVQTDAGSGTPTVTLKQDGDKLTGHYTGQLGDVDLTGSVKGSDFTFGFTSDLQGNKLDVTYKGTIVNNDELKGSVSIAGLGEGSFTAKRQ
jgi:hypothetical protein